MTVTHPRAVIAQLFGKRDQGGDVVMAGAYRKSLERLKREGRAVRVLPISRQGPR